MKTKSVRNFFTLAFVALMLISCGKSLKSQVIDEIEKCTEAQYYGNWTKW